MKKRLEIQIGPVPNAPDGFRILLDGQDVTKALRVKSFRLDVDAESGPTLVELRCYADAVTILPEEILVVREPIADQQMSSPAPEEPKEG